MQLRLARLRAEHGFAEFALEQSTTGTDTQRLVSVVVDPTRRLTSLTINTQDRSPELDALTHAVDEALAAAEAARSLHSYATARDAGLVSPEPLRRRFLTVPDRRDTEAAVMAQPAEPPAPAPVRRTGTGSVFAALGLEPDDAGDAEGRPAGRAEHGPVVGGDPERGVQVTLHTDGWTSALRLEPWLASTGPRELERAVQAAYSDAYSRLDERQARSGTSAD